MCQRGQGRTSTFTKLLSATFSVFLAAGVCGLAARAHESSAQEAPLDKMVQRLGLPGHRDLADVRKLGETPSASVGLLVSQLHTVSNPQRTVVGYGSIGVNHLLWVIGALRYITGGMDFCAPTSHSFGKSGEEAYRSYWLHFANKSCVTFFAVWPPRGRDYFAPLDAQRTIIRAWQQWYAREGSRYDYRPLVKARPTEWLEGVKKVVVIPPSGGRNK